MSDVLHIDNHRKRKTPANPTNIKFTKTRLEELDFDPNGKSTQYVWDTEIAGLGIRLYKTGTKSFWLAYRNEQNKKKFFKIGTFQTGYKENGERKVKDGGTTVKQARDQARIRLGEITKGLDPAKQRKQARSRDTSSKSFAEVARRYLDEYAKKKKKDATAATDERRLFPTDDHGDPDTSAHIYRLHSLEFNGELTRDDFEDELRLVHQRIGEETEVEANRVAQLVNAMLNWTVRERIISSNFIDICALWGRAPKIWFDEQSRDDHLRVSELRSFAEALAPEARKWRASVLLTLLTGARQRSEIHTLLWQNVRFDVGEFTFTGLEGDGTKNGTDHTLPMTAATRAILKAVSKTESPYVFHSGSKAGHLGKARRLYSRIRDRKTKATKSDFADSISAHPLRHTFSTIAKSKVGLPESVVNRIINHKEQGMSAVYTHVVLDDMRDALEKYEAFVLDQMGIEDVKTFIERGEL